jgi:hypothetical protein
MSTLQLSTSGLHKELDFDGDWVSMGDYAGELAGRFVKLGMCSHGPAGTMRHSRTPVGTRGERAGTKWDELLRKFYLRDQFLKSRD